jgi:hypothetical protein
MNATNDERKNKNADKNGSWNRDHFSFDDKRVEKVDEFMLVHFKFSLEVFCCAGLNALATDVTILRFSYAIISVQNLLQEDSDSALSVNYCKVIIYNFGKFLGLKLIADS